MDHIRVCKRIQLLLGKMHAFDGATACRQMSANAAEVDDLADARCLDGHSLIPAHLMDIFFPVRRRVMGGYHRINGIRSAKAGGQESGVPDAADKWSGARGDNGGASFRVTADDADMMARSDQPADQRPVNIAKGSEKYIIHDCKFESKTIPSLCF